MKIEYNATDGDAGLQVFLDAPAWREISITNPAGRKVVEVEAAEVIRDYGLTELFSESSEPPFTEFPFSEFKRLFPEGRCPIHEPGAAAISGPALGAVRPTLSVLGLS